MIRLRWFFFILAALFCLAGILQAADAPKSAFNTARVVAAEEAQREAILNKAETLVAEGKALVNKRKYPEGDAKFKEARLEFAKLAGNYVDLQLQKLDNYTRWFKLKWAKSEAVEARKAFADGKYDKAIVQAREVMQIDEIDPVMKDKMQAFVANCQKYIDGEKFHQAIQLEALDPEHSVRHYEIDVSMKQADILIKNKQYIRARDTLEKILVRDPYSIKAMTKLKRVYNELIKMGRIRHYNDTLERMAEIKWKWSEAVLPLPAIKPKSSGPIVSSRGFSGLYRKLNKLSNF